MPIPENPQSKEFEKRHQFRVKLVEPQSLLSTLYIYNGQEAELTLGSSSHFEHELFSDITATTWVRDDGYYYLHVGLKPQSDSERWSKEENRQLQSLLTNNYGYTIHQKEQVIADSSTNENSVYLMDSYEDAMDIIDLDFKDERVERYRFYVEGLSKINEDMLNYLKSKLRLPARGVSLSLLPIDQPDPRNPRLFPPPIRENLEILNRRITNWAQFIEGAVNAMSKVKGIPQSGILTLLPPEEIPQV